MKTTLSCRLRVLRFYSMSPVRAGRFVALALGAATATSGCSTLLGLDDEYYNAGNPLDAAGEGGGCSSLCKEGEKVCESLALRSCSMQPNGCLGWTLPIACPAGQVCSGGECLGQCENQCSVGSSRCSSSGGIQKCGMGISGCTDWDVPVPCQSGSCLDGQCTGECTDQCEKGRTRCSETLLQTCETASTGCTQWSAGVACSSPDAGKATCDTDKCVVSCDLGYHPCNGGCCSAVRTIALGHDHSCVLVEGGQVRCWGHNAFGQLGGESQGAADPPGMLVQLGQSASGLAAGDFFSCGVINSGAVKCWGNNGSGQLGNGGKKDSYAPVDATGLASGVAAIATGQAHTCALLEGGTVRCWGQNEMGQVGADFGANTELPGNVSGLGDTVVQLGLGERHSCVVTKTGGAKCWGVNYEGELGDGTNENRSSPVDVQGMNSPVESVVPGGGHTCALMSGGAVKCWGHNEQGAVGDGSTDDRWTPVDVVGLDSKVVMLASGGAHTCALTTNGGVKCWGMNQVGQLGDGSTQNRDRPVDVAGLAGAVRSIAAYQYQTCAIMTSGAAKCWGDNMSGQIGIGVAESHTPVDVSGI